jgi:hypothetical protein
MNPLPGYVAQRRVDHALALQARHPGEGDAFDLNGKVRLAGTIIACMATMIGAIVDDGKVGRCEGFIQKLSHFMSNRFGHGFLLEHDRPI